MSIIVNGITVPITGDFLFSNNINIDTVVANGITVWEKQKERIIYDNRSNSVCQEERPTRYYIDGNIHCLWRCDNDSCVYGTWGGHYSSEGEPMFSEGDVHLPKASPLLESLRDIDVTGYNYLRVECYGDIYKIPTGYQYSSYTLTIGFDTTHYKDIVLRGVWRDSITSEVTSDSISGIGQDGNGHYRWVSVDIPCADLNGIQRLRCWSRGGRFGGCAWLFVRYIKLQ